MLIGYAPEHSMVRLIMALFPALAIYFVLWFFLRNTVEGFSTPIQIGAQLLVALGALAVAFSWARF